MIKDPAEHFLIEATPNETLHLRKRQRLNSGTLTIQSLEDSVCDTRSVDASSMFAEEFELKKKQSKGYMFLAVALGMMCCSQIVEGVSRHCPEREQPETMSVQKLLNSAQSSPRNKRYLSSDFESKFVNMNLASREATADYAPSDKPIRDTAKIMKNLQSGLKGPLSNIVEGLMTGRYSHLTKQVQKTATFFWMSPSYNTLRLVRPVRADKQFAGDVEMN